MKSDVTKMRLRTTPDARAMIVNAAEQRGMSISKFVVQAAVERATCILDVHEDRPTLAELNAKFFAALDEEDRKRRQEIDRKAAEDAERTALTSADLTSPPHAA